MFETLTFLCVRFAQALVRADRDLHERKPEDMLKISEAIKTAEDYSKLTGQLNPPQNKKRRIMVYILPVVHLE